MMMNFKKRRETFLKEMEKHDYSMVVITDPSTIYYLTGFHSALGIEWGRPELFILTSESEPIIITPSMEEEMARKQTKIDNVIPWTDGLDDEWRKPLQRYLKMYEGKKIGVDYYAMPRVVWDFITDFIDEQNISDITPIINRMRMIKDESEIQIARHTGQVAVAMLEGAMEVAAPGVEVYEVSLAAMEAGTRKAAQLMKEYYQDDEPFNYPTIGNQQIMASGHHTTMCHHRNNLTKLEHGEPLFICHCGTVRFKGFYLGFDRTLFVGEINDEVSKLLEVAEAAQKAALSEVRPGAIAEDVFLAYAEVIQNAGYPIPFRAGRSVGFSENEQPQLAKGDKTVLQPGMIFAVDGGADAPNYRTQVGDSILVTEDGFEFLTPFTKKHEELVVGK